MAAKVAIGLTVLSTIALFFFPETPIFLVKQNRKYVSTLDKHRFDILEIINADKINRRFIDRMLKNQLDFIEI